LLILCLLVTNVVTVNAYAEDLSSGAEGAFIAPATEPVTEPTATSSVASAVEEPPTESETIPLAPEATGARLFLSGDGSVLAGEEAGYVFSVADVDRLAAVTLRFEVNVEYFTNIDTAVYGGFEIVNDILWEEAGDSVFVGTVTLVHSNGEVAIGVYEDIFELRLLARSEAGTTDVRLIDAELNGYNEAGEAVTFETLVESGVVSTEILHDEPISDIDTDTEDETTPLDSDAPELLGTRLSLSGDSSVPVEEEASYVFSIANVDRLAAITLRFEVNVEYFTDINTATFGGFEIANDILWEEAGGSVFIGSVTRTHPDDEVSIGAYEDIFELRLLARSEVGTTDVRLIDAELSGYNEAGEAVTFETLVESGLVSTQIMLNGPLSAVDVDRDGQVGQLDLTLVQFYYGATQDDGNWDEAQIADLSGDGRADIEDMIMILGLIDWGTPQDMPAPADQDPAEPAPVDSFFSDPLLTDPTPTDPVFAETVPTDSFFAEPAATEPFLAEPITVEPAPTDPITSDPGSFIASSNEVYTDDSGFSIASSDFGY
jgi:hypothetical protein